MMHRRQSTAGFPSRKLGEMLLDFCCRNLATIPITLGKYRSRPHPFQNQTSKPNTFKALKANGNRLFSIANI